MYKTWLRPLQPEEVKEAAAGAAHTNPRWRRRRRRLEPGCGAVRQARERGADGSNMAAPNLSRDIVGIAAAEQGFWKALCT